MTTRAFLEEEDYVDFTDDVPLKLRSFLEFLDDVKAASVGSTTEERQHVSSNDSESEEETQMAETPSSLRLTAVLTTAAQCNQCYCLDKVKCMCNSFALPPLLTCKPSLAAPTAAMALGVPPLGNHGSLSSGLLDEAAKTAAPARTALSPSGLGEVCYVPLRLSELHFAQPQQKQQQQGAAAHRYTSMACCRC